MHSDVIVNSDRLLGGGDEAWFDKLTMIDYQL